MLAAGLLMTGCSKDNPFGDDPSAEAGQVLKSSLDITRTADPILVTRADADIDQFVVSFIKEGNTTATASFLYGEMSDVVTLPAGTYTARVTYGDDHEAAWENPYFLGASAKFEVVAKEITSYIEPIECALNNVKATIEFDPSLAAAMSEDSYVEVKVGDNQGLNFTTAEANAGKAGFFRHTEETTLVATFHGKVNGTEIVETKSYQNVQKGYWYKLTFKLHQGGGSATGDGDATVKVDASVTSENINTGVEIPGDEPLDDSERPTEGPDTPDPGPDDPTPPAGQAPQIVPSGNVVFDQVMNVDASSQCAFSITSSAEGGFTALTCDIISDNLTPEELAGVGLASHIDLVNPGSMESGLVGLGFPVNVAGQKKVDFDLSQFMSLMAVFGANQHTFKLTVTDANGTTVKSLILQF